MKSFTSRSTLRISAIAAIASALVSVGTISAASASEALQVESSALRSAQLNRQVMRDYGGHYRLEDGSVLRFSREGARLFASISKDAGERRVEVKAISANRFVAVNEATEFRFANTGADQVTVSRTLNSQLAQVAQPTSQPAL